MKNYIYNMRKPMAKEGYLELSEDLQNFDLSDV